MLLDANVLIVLVVREHVNHEAAEQWLAEGSFTFATCPTEGNLVRPVFSWSKMMSFFYGNGSLEAPAGRIAS